MRLVAFSDPHRDLDATRAFVSASRDADVAIGAGDFGDRGHGARAVLDLLAGIRCPLLLVSGNHDRLDELADIVDRWPHVRLLHGTAVDVDGMRFLGLGSAVAEVQPSPNSEWLHERDAAAHLDQHIHCDVLISHTPPRGAADAHPDGSWGGSSAVRDAVLRLQPLICLCGHVHRSHGVRTYIGRTLVHNLGPGISEHRICKDAATDDSD